MVNPFRPTGRLDSLIFPGQWEGGKESSILKPILEAIDKTMNEIDTEVESVNGKVQAAIAEQANQLTVRVVNESVLLIDEAVVNQEALVVFEDDQHNPNHQPKLPKH